MDYIEAAAALGRAITESNEYREFKAAEYAAVNDREAAALLIGYRRAQEEMARAAGDGVGGEELETVRSLLLAKQREMDASPVIKRYLEAKRAYDRMMQEVDGVLAHLIGGGSGECSGSCESCGGCG